MTALRNFLHYCRSKSHGSRTFDIAFNNCFDITVVWQLRRSPGSVNGCSIGAFIGGYLLIIERHKGSLC
jgi:hypothetical protein